MNAQTPQTQPEVQKFQEPAPAAPQIPVQRPPHQGSTQRAQVAAVVPAPAAEAVNPFIPAPVVEVPQVPTTPIASHDKLWLDTKALILSARRLGVDFEVLLRGALQEIEKGHV